MGMHFKLGLYEHQSAGAIQGILNLVSQQPTLRGVGDGGEQSAVERIKRIRVTA